MGAREAADQPAQRVRDRLEQRLGDAWWQRRAERIAERRGVRGIGPVLLTADPHPHRPPRALEFLQRGLGVGHGAAQVHLDGGQGTENSEQISDLVDRSGPTVLREPLQLGLGVRDGLRVQQVAQRETVPVAEELREERRVDGEGRRPPLRERRVALVQELRDISEQQRGGER